MYDTLIMLKSGASFTVEELHAVVLSVMQSKPKAVERNGSHIRIATGSGSLNISWNNAAHVVEESNEIAERFGAPSQGLCARFEMTGDDPDMELFNDYLLINERLQETGKFIIFDTQECKLLFE